MSQRADHAVLALSCFVSLCLSARWARNNFLDRISFVVYAITNTAATCVCALLLLEVVSPARGQDRMKLNAAATNTLLALLIVALPAVQAVRVACRTSGTGVSGTRTCRRRLVLAAALYLCYAALMLFVAARFPGVSKERGLPALRHKLQDAISCVGIILMAGICGFSSVSAAYTAFFQSQPTGTEALLQRLQASIHNTDSLIREQELQVARFRMDSTRLSMGHDALSPLPSSPQISGIPLLSPVILHGHESGSSSGGSGSGGGGISGSSGGGFFGSLVPRIASIFRPSNHQALAEAEQELATLKKLRNEFAADLAGVQDRYQDELFAQTVRGRIWRVLFAVFASYCVYRVVMGYVRLGWYLNDGHIQGGRSRPRDAFVWWLANNANAYQPELSAEGWARVLGLLVSVCIIFTSVRGARVTATKLLRKLRHSRTSQLAEMDPISTAGVFAIYTLAIGTSLQLNIPRSLTSGVAAAAKLSLNVETMQLLNDITLCVASTVTAALLVLTAYINTDRVEDLECPYEKYE